MSIHKECLEQVIRWCDPTTQQVNRERLDWEMSNSTTLPRDRYQDGVEAAVRYLEGWAINHRSPHLAKAIEDIRKALLP